MRARPGWVVVGGVAALFAGCSSRESTSTTAPELAKPTVTLHDECTGLGFYPPRFNQPVPPVDGSCQYALGIANYCPTGAGVWPTRGFDDPESECWCSGGCDPGPDASAPDAGADADAEAGAPLCSTEPTYPPPQTLDTGRLELGYDVPEPAAGFVCGQLAAIPYVGQALFSPGGGLGFTVDIQAQESSQWKPTCVEETSTSFAAGITVNICSLEAMGRWERTRGLKNQRCVNCDPEPATCGDVACRDESETQTRQASLSRTFAIPLGSSGCGSAPSSRWIDWIKRNVNVSASLGGGWTGTGRDSLRSPGPATCDQTCTACDTRYDKNSVFVQARGTASMSTPTWGGISGMASVSVFGRAGVGREDETSTCAPACGGYDAEALVSLRLSVSAGAFGYRIGKSVGYTCQWRNSWSTCPNANAQNRNVCRWSNPTDP
ncbi:MAG: hypothetical protein U0169_04415 [Polyangiaceae bacterium]